jgi:hypothetical protein
MAKVHPTFEMDRLVLFMVYTCPQCGKNRHAATGLHSGSIVKCRCGQTEVTVSGADEVQRALDNLKKTLQPSTKAIKVPGGTIKIKKTLK